MKKLKKSVKILLALVMMTGLIGSVQYRRHDLFRVPSAAEGTAVEPKESETSPPPNLSRRDIDRIITAKSRKHGIDPRLVRSVVWVESKYDQNAVSSAGALGLMQLMPATAKGLGVNNPFCPRENVDGGIRYLKWLLKHYRYNTELALAAYNAGPGNVKKYNGIPPFPETIKYIASVRTAMAEF